MCLICLKRGGPRKRLRRKIYSRSVGRGPSSSQSPYPSLSAYAESSLIPTLVLSPRKPLRWVFTGAPVLLKFSAVRPRRTAIVRRRVQDRFDLRFPSAAALPTSQRFILIFYPGSAKRSGERGKRSRGHTTTTPESRTHASNCGEAPHSSACVGRTRYKLASLERTVSHGPFLFLARPGGPHENPAKRFSWGEEKETERCETCPSGRGEYSEVSFDDNGGIPVTGLPVQIFTACPAPAAPARYRAGPTG